MKWLYQLHGYLVERQYCDDRGPTARHWVYLAVVRWMLDKIQMRQIRYGPTIGCPICQTKNRICVGCRQKRKEMWG